MASKIFYSASPSPMQEDQRSTGSSARRLESTSSGDSRSIRWRNFLRAMTSALCGKIFWVLLVACGTAILIYGLYRTRTNRLIIQNGGGTSDNVFSPQQQQGWSNYYDIVAKSEMEFPIIYVCPSNYINNSLLQNISDAEHLLRLYRKSLIVQPQKNENNQTKRQAKPKEEINNLNYSTTEEMYKTFMSIGYDQDELFMACSFRSFFTKILPCEEIVKSVLDPNFGKCYMVDVTQSRKQEIPGQGLILVLNLHENLFPTLPHLAPVTKGYVLRIGNRIDPSDFRFLYVSSGTYTKVDMSSERVIYDNGQCTNNELADNGMAILAGNYTRSACLLDCFLQNVKRTCDCVPLMDHYFLKNPQENYCTMEIIDSCVLPNVTANADSLEEIQQCKAGCLPACQVWNYNTRLSQVPLNPDAGVVKLGGVKVQDLTYLHLAFGDFHEKIFHQYRPLSPVAFLPSSAEMLSSNVLADNFSPIPQRESLWVVAGIAVLIQVPTAIALICLFALYRQIYKALPIVH